MAHNYCMVKYVGSTTTSFVGQELAQNETYLIPDAERERWTFAANTSDSVLQNCLNDQTILVSKDGTNYLDSIIDSFICLTESANAITHSSVFPFADKLTEDGKKLFKRCTGIPGVQIATGATGNLDYVVAFAQMKIIGASVHNTNIGDTANFYVYDDASGTYSGTPNALLNQFGYNVNMPDGSVENTCKYDADLYYGMKVRIAYTNNSGATKTVYVNFDLHEVV